MTAHAATHRPFRARRYLALVVYLSALVVAVVLSGPVLFPDGPPVDASASAPPVRPAGVPAVIPGWAWRLNVWHETQGSQRGRRPRGAPTPLPRWYWAWHAWRVETQHRADA